MRLLFQYNDHDDASLYGWWSMCHANFLFKFVSYFLQLFYTILVLKLLFGSKFKSMN